MNCPCCGALMKEGGLVANCVAPAWVPMEQFQRKGTKRLMYTDGKAIGESNLLLGQTRIPNAFFCNNCNKIVGVFDITDV